MNRETQLKPQEEKPGFIISAVKYIGSNVFGFLFEQYINVMHSILSAAQTQMLSLVPKDSPIMDKYQQAELMNEAINAAFQDPRVQESLKAFQQNIKDVIQPFLAELTELFEKEGETLEKSAVKVVDTVVRNSVNIGYESLVGVLNTLPGVGTVMSLLKVIQGIIDNGSIITTEGMKAYTMFMQAFLRVVGETSGPMATTVRNANGLLQNATRVRNELAENLEKIPRTYNTTLNKKVGQLNQFKDNVNRLAGNINTAASIISNPRGHFEKLVKDQVAEPIRQLHGTVNELHDTIQNATNIAKNPTGYLKEVATDQIEQATAPIRQIKASLVGGRKKKRTIKSRRR